MHKKPLPPNTHLEFNTVYFTYMPVTNNTKKMSNNKTNTKLSSPKQKRASKSNKQKSSKGAKEEGFQEIHIGELDTAKTPISPESLQSSSAWQHASMMLKQQQMNSTLKSAEERDQDLSASERSYENQSAYGYDSARIGSASCWNSLQSIFMIPQGLADIKASHATTLGDPNSRANDLSGRVMNSGGSGVPRSKFSNGQIEQTSSRIQASSKNYRTSLSEQC
mmetsp:Transcript_205/g.297  ORF Transcript_205/g.297 Transcript_205/m.297 type:complete len:222 (+) Transcript_205:69-734(+)